MLPRKVIVLSIVVLGWIPYVVVRGYWEYVRSSVPGAEHGELSGPILFLLPRLLLVASVTSVVVTALYWKLATRTAGCR